MNPFHTDRDAIAHALESTGFRIYTTPPEIIEAQSIILGYSSVEPGNRFYSFAVSYPVTVVLKPTDSAISARAQADAATWEIIRALGETGAADFTRADPLYNLTDASNNIYPAFNVNLTSYIDTDASGGEDNTTEREDHGIEAN